MTPFWVIVEGYIGYLCDKYGLYAALVVVSYSLGVMTMALLRNHDLFPKKPKPVTTSVEAALKTVKWHRDNSPDDEDIIAY